ncbi:hypothetical protein Nepgr_013569 [Nepenthes gracilis]|uniref:Uncharacterized protein n=1 Tax=Nepenthes gracilis TaxID=150966 RepID=A0AAD3XP47_NEPGR|nr:hypothetical protein Nepgr_013569 [Nepenthes gracilis]
MKLRESIQGNNNRSRSSSNQPKTAASLQKRAWEQSSNLQVTKIVELSNPGECERRLSVSSIANLPCRSKLAAKQGNVNQPDFTYLPPTVPGACESRSQIVQKNFFVQSTGIHSGKL